MDTHNKFWNDKWSQLKDNNIWATSFGLDFIKYIWNKNWKTILDVWCWAWRDTLYFAEHWYHVDWLDFSSAALGSLKLKIAWEYSTHLLHWNIIDYKFTKKYNYIYSCNSLHYFDSHTTKIIFNKLYDTLEKYWIFFLRVKSIYDWSYGSWKELWDDFYDNNWDIKHYFSENFAREIFERFHIIDLKFSDEEHNKISWNNKKCWYLDIIAVKSNKI